MNKLVLTQNSVTLQECLLQETMWNLKEMHISLIQVFKEELAKKKTALQDHIFQDNG